LPFVEKHRTSCGETRNWKPHDLESNICAALRAAKNCLCIAFVMQSPGNAKKGNATAASNWRIALRCPTLPQRQTCLKQNYCERFL